MTEYNVIFITLDSCTYETAQKALTKNLDSLCELKRAETHGTYTYPAHHAFFTGSLPNILDKNKFYIEKYSRIWKPGMARKNPNEKVAITFNEKNIIDYYQKNGFNVLGCGGVSFFDSTNKNNTLPSLFNKFIYFGPTQDVLREKRIPRDKKYFPLSNTGTIIKEIDKELPYFLFINCPETHIPYDRPEAKLSPGDRDLILRLYKEHDLKKLYPTNKLPFSREELDSLKQRQIDALEWVDCQLGLLFKQITSKNRTTLVIVCSDHGEEFGEGGRFGHFHAHRTILEVPLWVGTI